MKNKYSIGFFATILVLLVAVSFAYQTSYEHAREEVEARISAAKEVRAEAQRSQEAVSADGHARKEECYYLKNVNGYVVVYLSDHKTAYEYTDILCEELPKTIQEELKNGKYIKSLDELYGFLENYSS